MPGTRTRRRSKDDFRYDLQVSYGFLQWKWAELTADASIGYFQGDVGDLESRASSTSWTRCASCAAR
jgi:hypothetical protein